MLGAEAAYTGLEAELKNYLDTYESGRLCPLLVLLSVALFLPVPGEKVFG
mgnify:CR=1 FL=1